MSAGLTRYERDIVDQAIEDRLQVLDTSISRTDWPIPFDIIETWKAQRTALMSAREKIKLLRVER